MVGSKKPVMDVFKDAKVGEQGRVLRNHADGPPVGRDKDVGGRVGEYAVSGDQRSVVRHNGMARDYSCVLGREQAGDGAEDGRLSRAGWGEKDRPRLSELEGGIELESAERVLHLERQMGLL